VKWEGGEYDWANDFDEFVKNQIDTHQYNELINYQKLGSIASLAHPSNDHYLPLLYTLGLSDKHDTHQFFNTHFDLGSVSMRSVIFSQDTYHF
jgi:4,5-DOPA dioxygenase extradiol